jgi:hypothetical protein
MTFVPEYVAIFTQPLKIIIYTVVTDRTAFFVRFQVPFGNVCPLGGPVDQNVIPGAVFWRLASGDILIPVVAAMEFGINVNNDTAITK